MPKAVIAPRRPGAEASGALDVPGGAPLRGPARAWRWVTAERWRSAVAFYVAVSALIVSPAWTTAVAPIWDAYNYFYPAFVRLAEAVRAGHLPLWDPYTNCGLPYHADPQAGTLNPLALALALAIPRPSLAFTLFWVAHWILAGLGMFVVTRALRATPGGAIVAAFSYAFSGFFLGHAQHTSWIVTAAWLPWAIGLAHLAVASGRWGFALLAGAAMAMSALGGYPVLVGVGLFTLSLWLALAFLGPWARFEGTTPAPFLRVWRVIATVGITTAVLVLVWAPVLHAFVREAAGYTDRASPVPPNVAMTWQPFSARAAISLLFPYITVAGLEWIPWDRAMNDAFVGVVTLPLAAVAFTSRRRRAGLAWLLALGAFMVVVSLGTGGEFRRVLHEILPVMKYMRHNAGYRVFWILPLCAAAGVGFSLVHASARARARFRWAFGITSVAAIGIGALVLAVYVSLSKATPKVFMYTYLHAVLFLPAIAYVVRTWRVSPPRGWTRWALVGILVADVGVHLHLTAKTVWAGRHRIVRAEAMRITGDPASPREVGNTYGTFNAHQVTRTPVAGGYVTMQSRGFNEVLLPSRFLEILRAHRYWLSPSAAVAPPAAGALEILAQRGAGDPVPVFVERADAVLQGEPVVPGTFGEARITAYEDERVALDVVVPGPAPAVLASTDRFAPGWRVEVDGIPASALRTNLYFRGVVVPAGRHTVAWRYEPAGWNTLVVVAMLALTASVAGGLALLRNAHRPSPAGALAGPGEAADTDPAAAV